MTSEFLPFDAGRVRVRAMTPDDAEALAVYRSDPHIARFQSWDAPYPIEAARRLIDGQSALSGPTPGDWIQLGVEFERELAGDVAVKLSDDGRIATIGYTLDRARQGRGLATDAVGGVVQRLFEQLGVHRVEASLDPRNIASARLVERLGFEFEGTAVSSEWADGEWLDADRYALTTDARAAWHARPRQEAAEVRLVEVTPDNVHGLRKLRTHHTERRFVAPMEGSFADALAPEDEGGFPVVPWLRGIEADGELAGFMMVAERTEHHPEAYLWRLLIDRRHQRRGIGRRAVLALADRLRREGHTGLAVSYVPAPGGPEPMYRKLGFVPTGEMEDDEVVARLDLTSA